MRLRTLFCSLLVVALHAAATEKPNVLMLILDDMNDWLGAIGVSKDHGVMQGEGQNVPDRSLS